MASSEDREAKAASGCRDAGGGGFEGVVRSIIAGAWAEALAKRISGRGTCVAPDDGQSCLQKRRTQVRSAVVSEDGRRRDSRA